MGPKCRKANWEGWGGAGKRGHGWTQVIAYEQEERPRFSVLWSDADRMYRHMMDFYLSPLEARKG